MSSTLTASTEAQQATALWDELRGALAHFDDALTRIIRDRAWEPLGYDTFAQAWADRMRGLRLGTSEMAALVVYALIDSGLDREEALSTLGPTSGVGPTTFDVLARQKSAGVPANLATTRPRFTFRGPGPASIPGPITTVPGLTVVRQHERERPSEPRTVHVELDPAEYAHLKDVCERLNLDLDSEAAKAVRAHFRAIERRWATDAEL